MKGVIYIRVSSEEQVRGTSLEHQDDLCRAYCQNKDIEVVGMFREEGASAKTAERAEFLRAIEYCRKNKGKIGAFVVYKVDRFARNTEDHFYVRKMLIDYGVTLHSVTEPIGNNPAEKFIETVLAGSAEFDNAIRTQRCVDGMIARINQGINPFIPPLGYDCPQTRKRGEKKNVPDKPNKEIFPIIQKGLKEFSKGIYSQVEMLQLFDKLGLSKIRGVETRPQLVSRIFGKYLRFYAGILVNPWTSEEVQGLHKPMITKEEYFKIQAILLGKSNRAKRVRLNPSFPLRQTVKCGYCGKQLTGSCSHGNGGKYYYYHCYNKECSMYGKAINKEKLESDFIKLLGEITPLNEFFVLYKETVLDLWEENGQGFKLEAQKYEKHLADLEGRRKRIFEMRENESYTVEEFKERKAEVDNQIMATKISLSEARIEQFDIEAAVTYAKNYICNLGRQWQDLAISQSRKRWYFPKELPISGMKGLEPPSWGLSTNLIRLVGLINPF